MGFSQPCNLSLIRFAPMRGVGDTSLSNHLKERHLFVEFGIARLLIWGGNVDFQESQRVPCHTNPLFFKRFW